MTVRMVLRLVFCLALSAAAAVRADGFYIGAGAYVAEFEVDAFDDDEVVPAAFVGYQFLDSNFLMLSAEGGYYDLGGSTGTVGGDDYDVDSSAFTLAGVAYLPIGPFFELYAKLGGAMMDSDVRINGQERSDDDSGVFGGAGFAFDILDTIDLYVEYLNFDNEINTQMVGAGVRLDFF